MDWDQFFKENWEQHTHPLAVVIGLKGSVQHQWDRLTDQDVGQIAGSREQLEGKIQKRYGLAEDLVRREVIKWLEQYEVTWGQIDDAQELALSLKAQEDEEAE